MDEHIKNRATETLAAIGLPVSDGRWERHAPPGKRAPRIGVSVPFSLRQSGCCCARMASTLLPPGTLVSYTVELSKVVDFRAGYRPGA